MRRLALALLCCAAVAAAVLGVVAVRSGGSNGPQKPGVRVASPACAQAGKAIRRPPEVPGALLPSGTVLTASRRLGQRQTLVTGVIPREFRLAVDFFVTKLPAAGYRNGAGDAEMDEAEASFVGPGLTGKWKVNGILNCPQAVTLALLVNR
jgi:hypothetical protein